MNGYAERFGIAKSEFLQGAGDIGVVVDAMKLGADATAAMSVELTKLGGDLASLRNKSFEDVMIALRAGLGGESEPLKGLGIFVNEDIVKAKAYAMGIAEVGAKLTDGQKIQARYALIMEQTVKAQGDLERNAGELANSLRAVEGRFENLQASVGAGVDIIGKGFLGVLSDGFMSLTSGAAETTEAMKLWSAESIRAGGLVNEAFGWAGQGVAFYLDYLSYASDGVQAFVITVGNLFTGLATTVIDAGLAMGEVFESISGKELGFLDTVQTFRDALVDRNEELLAYRDTLFQGSDTADKVRSFVEQSQTRLDAIGRSSQTLVQATGDALTDITSTTSAEVTKAAKDGLAESLTFGSADALSAINKHASRSGPEPAVRVQQDQLTVQQQTLTEIRKLVVSAARGVGEALELI